MVTDESGRRLGVGVSDIFREIDEELRRDNLLKLWKRYGKYVIAAVVVGVAIAVAIWWWLGHQASERRAQSGRYTQALSLTEANGAEAAKLFAALSEEGGGYSVLATFEAAELLAKNGDRKAAVEAYDHIAASNAFDREFRDLATLLAAMHALAEDDPKAVIDRVQSLTESGSPWRASALDLIAAAKLKAGDRGGAVDIYKKLADDLTAPQRLRARAAELAAALAP
jgi:hypothetical protein